MRFTRLTELCLLDKKKKATWPPISSDIPLLQITHLAIKYQSYSTDQLLGYLAYLGNVYSLALWTIPTPASESTSTIHSSKEKNGITKLDLGNYSCRLEDVCCLCQMFPFVQYLIICILEGSCDKIAEYLLSTHNPDRPQYLCCLYVTNRSYELTNALQALVDRGHRLVDYTAVKTAFGYFLWW